MLSKINFSKLLILLAVSLVVVMVNADLTAVNLGIVPIAHSLHQSLLKTQWVLSAYMIAWAVFLIPAGRIADRYGCRRFFLWGLILFGLGSLAASLSTQLWSLVSSRMLQGLGAALFVPTGYTITANTFNEKLQPMAFGVIGFALGLGLTMGPTLGGYLIKVAGWPWIFYINLPIVLLIIVLTLFLVQRDGKAERCDSKLGDIFKLFLNKKFSATLVLNGCSAFCYTMVIFILSIYLQTQRHIPVFRSGLILLSLTLSFGVVSVLSGVLSHFCSAKKIILTSFLILALALADLAFLPMHSLLVYFMLLIGLIGISFGLFFPVINSLMIQSVSENEIGIGSSFFTMVELLANAAGILFATKVIIYLPAFQTGMQVAMLTGSVIALFGLLYGMRQALSS